MSPIVTGKVIAPVGRTLGGLRMTWTRALRRRIRAAIPPLIFLLIAGYFAWNATQGTLGLKAYAQREQDLKTAQLGLAHAQQELTEWERRVAALRASHLDPDLLDERARAMLNLASPEDVIIPFGPRERLY